MLLFPNFLDFASILLLWRMITTSLPFWETACKSMWNILWELTKVIIEITPNKITHPPTEENVIEIYGIIYCPLSTHFAFDTFKCSIHFRAGFQEPLLSLWRGFHVMESCETICRILVPYHDLPVFFTEEGEIIGNLFFSELCSSNISIHFSFSLCKPKSLRFQMYFQFFIN